MASMAKLLPSFRTSNVNRPGQLVSNVSLQKTGEKTEEVNEENLHYSSVNGDWALRRAVAKYYNETLSWRNGRKASGKDEVWTFVLEM